MTDNQQHRYASEEQQVYAIWLDWGMRIGFMILVASFAGYLFGVFEPYVPVEKLPEYWSMSANDYLDAAQVPTGWGWLALAHKGDFMNFVGIVFLSAVTIVCYLRVIPIFLRDGDRAYTIIAGVTVLVLLLAASGILVIGH
ncbi:hypothetical protein [Thiohalophilus sp.]|uniref:hypothetical protein n=1 Tax=Thiohalophilus sp. TaxID=3028392 RepID=UPI002ACDE44A|nr:hypothetical protein [Thiohalophilus sp.]MDZ7663584.1 hypothetical protein [Thiohalophilus sp.]